MMKMIHRGSAISSPLPLRTSLQQRRVQTIRMLGSSPPLLEYLLCPSQTRHDAVQLSQSQQQERRRHCQVSKRSFSALRPFDIGNSMNVFSPLMRSIAINYTTLSTRNFSTRNNSTSANDKNIGDEPSDVESAIATVTTTTTPPHRSFAWAAVIREGLAELTDSATRIQTHRKSRLPLMHKAVAAGPTDRQLMEQARLTRVIQTCLEAMVDKQDALLCIRGEPIVIVDVYVKPSLRSAWVTWTLPYTILWDTNLTFVQKEWLKFQMQQTIEHKGGGAQLQRRVSAVLRSYYPPKLHFKPEDGDNSKEWRETLDDFMLESDDDEEEEVAIESDMKEKS
jgi:hypothetical protein